MQAMMKKIERGYRLAAKAALSSNAPARRSRVGAALLRAGKPVSTGWNRYALREYTRERYVPSRHAELHCLIRLTDEQVRDCTLFVVRLLADGFGLSKPCPECMKLIRKSGVREVYFIGIGGRPEKIEVA